MASPSHIHHDSSTSDIEDVQQATQGNEFSQAEERKAKTSSSSSSSSDEEASNNPEKQRMDTDNLSMADRFVNNISINVYFRQP